MFKSIYIFAQQFAALTSDRQNDQTQEYHNVRQPRVRPMEREHSRKTASIATARRVSHSELSRNSNICSLLCANGSDTFSCDKVHSVHCFCPHRNRCVPFRVKVKWSACCLEGAAIFSHARLHVWDEIVLCGVCWASYCRCVYLLFICACCWNTHECVQIRRCDDGGGVAKREIITL